MSIAAYKTGESAKESALVAILADHYMRYGLDSQAAHALCMNLGKPEQERIVEKAKALVESLRTADHHKKEEGFLASMLELLSPFLGILFLIVLCLPYGLFEWLLEAKGSFSFAALGLTVVFWVVVFVALPFTPWKKLRPNRQWLLSPIRFLRRQFRRLEAATRP